MKGFMLYLFHLFCSSIICNIRWMSLTSPFDTTQERLRLQTIGDQVPSQMHNFWILWSTALVAKILTSRHKQAPSITSYTHGIESSPGERKARYDCKQHKLCVLGYFFCKFILYLYLFWFFTSYATRMAILMLVYAVKYMRVFLVFPFTFLILFF